MYQPAESKKDFDAVRLGVFTIPGPPLAHLNCGIRVQAPDRDIAANLPDVDQLGDDTEKAQITFVSALTASAFGLAATGSIDYAWSSFENAFKSCIFFNARRK